MTNEQIAQKGSDLEHASDRDCMSFARAHQRHESSAVKALANFALFKTCARGHRLAGRIGEALIYEGYAEAAYNTLPKGARW